MDGDPLWTPLIGHYRGDGSLDADRVRRHVAAIAPDVRQYLLAGTTGDGWTMSDAVLRQWLALASRPDAFGPDQSFLVGAFGGTTDAAIERAAMIEDHFLHHRPAADFAGLTLCAPVDPHASQQRIADHFRAILAATAAPVAIYQLPQVVGCTIAPETLAALARGEPRIILFKDTSGADAVAGSGLDFGDVRLLRGAEGDYARWLRPAGPYHGWLLSTGNGFAGRLRKIAELAQGGRPAEAGLLSERLSRLVEAIFAQAGALGGNAFADASRAVDHLAARGAAWRTAPPPVRGDGSILPAAFIATAEFLLSEERWLSANGYLADA